MPADDFVKMVSNPAVLGNPLLKTQHLIGGTRWERVNKKSEYISTNANLVNTSVMLQFRFVALRVVFSWAVLPISSVQCVDSWEKGPPLLLYQSTVTSIESGKASSYIRIDSSHDASRRRLVKHETNTVSAKVILSLLATDALTILSQSSFFQAPNKAYSPLQNLRSHVSPPM